MHGALLFALAEPPHRSTNWSDTCGAKIAQDFGGARTSAAIWWRCVSPRSARAIRRQHLGRASGEGKGPRQQDVLILWPHSMFARRTRIRTVRPVPGLSILSLRTGFAPQ